MRWDYSTPEPKQFVSDGVKMYSYIPQDKQVIVAAVPPDDEAPTPTLFLAGKGSLTRDFTPRSSMPRRHARRQPDAEARAESPPAGLRLAGLVSTRRRLAIRGLLTSRRPGGQIELSLHEI
jgi:hypothetical protein